MMTIKSFEQLKAKVEGNLTLEQRIAREGYKPRKLKFVRESDSAQISTCGCYRVVRLEINDVPRYLLYSLREPRRGAVEIGHTYATHREAKNAAQAHWDGKQLDCGHGQIVQNGCVICEKKIGHPLEEGDGTL